MKYLLLICLTVLFSGCISKKAYPKEWTTINTQCEKISAIYKDQNDKEDTLDYMDLYSKVFPYIKSKDSTFDIRSVKFIRLEKRKDVINVFALDRDYKVLNINQLEVLSDCKNGFFDIEYKREDKGVFRDGVLGYSSQKLKIGNNWYKFALLESK